MSRGELFILTIKDGKAIFKNRGHWDSWVIFKSQTSPGDYIMRPPTPFKDTRHIGQNNLYWKRNYELSDYSGFTSDELHEYFMHVCGYYLPRKKTMFDVEFISRESSTKLSIHEFSMLMKEQDKICNRINQMSEGEPDRVWLSLTSNEKYQ